VIRDPEHAGKRHVWEPGDPAFVCEVGFADRGTKPEGHKVPMNGRGKSDSLVVPEKLSNKAPDRVAERVEGRGLAKGNLLKVAHAGRSAGKVRHLLSGGYAKPLCDVASLPEAGAGCGSSARPDLCGGRPARAVPTAIVGVLRDEGGSGLNIGCLSLRAISVCLVARFSVLVRPRGQADGGTGLTGRRGEATWSPSLSPPSPPPPVARRRGRD